MHFLLTNDDGIDAVGLKALSAAVLEKGHTLIVSAPQTQQSATSHSVTLRAPLLVQEVQWEGAKAYAVAGSPADCARMGVELSDKPIDFVFSGINNGDNAGTAIYYSGTFSAAREARMLRLKSMAVSIHPHATWDMLMHLARLAVRIAESFEHTDLPRLCVINLNAPALPVEDLKPLRLAPVSQSFFLDAYEQRTDLRGNPYFWLKPGIVMESIEEGSDLDLLHKGHITCSFVMPSPDCNAEYTEKMQDFLL